MKKLFILMSLISLSMQAIPTGKMSPKLAARIARTLIKNNQFSNGRNRLLQERNNLLRRNEDRKDFIVTVGVGVGIVAFLDKYIFEPLIPLIVKKFN